MVFELRGFVDALLGRNKGGPFANLKSATIWAQDLPENDTQEALETIVAALVSVNESRAAPLLNRIQVLMYLDQTAAPLRDGLCRDYLAHGVDPDAPEALYLPTILSFWEEMAAGYHQCLREFAKGRGSPKIRPMLPLLTARAIRCFAMQAKWCYLRYLPVEEGIWRHLHQLYLLAEREGFAQTPLRPYPQAKGETTCSAEYLRPLMLHLANPESLPPREIDMADLWLCGWARELSLETVFCPQRQLYAVNLAQGEPGKKLRRNMLGPKYRYWDVEPLLARIARTTENLRQGEFPARLGLGEACRLPACLDLIQLVATRWSGKGGMRRHQRREAGKKVRVILGLRAVLARAQGDNPGVADRAAPALCSPDLALAPAPSPPDAQKEELFERGQSPWTLENESTSGYALAFEQGPGPRPGVGSLVGLWPDPGTLALGIVRRVNRDLSGKARLGIETLAVSPLAVRLQPTDGAALDALYLPGMPACQVARSLLIPGDAYVRERIVELAAQGKRYTVRFQQVDERTEDYARVRFTVLARR